MKLLNLILLILFYNSMVIAVSFCEETEFAEEERLNFVFPTFIYSTDTGFGAGIFGIKGYNPSRSRTSTAQLYSLYTLKKQFITSFRLDHYFPKNSDRIGFTCQYQKFPTYFYGMGNSTQNTDPEKYTPESFYIHFFYERRLKGHFRVKTHLYVTNQSLVKTEPEGMIRSPIIPWNTGRLDAGPGIGILWDSRDNIIATNRGSFAMLEYQGIMFQDEGGAFNSLSLDMRTFMNPLHDTVLGFMIWFQNMQGNVPFYLLAKLGGNDRLRGYELERFRDRSLILFQCDFRYPIWGPFGGAVFAASGRVDDEIAELLSGSYHTGYGAGLRYYFNKKENLVIRVDAARGNDSHGFYITFGEAF